MENANLLVPFLRKLADEIEQKKLDTTQLKKIGEFVMSYQFQEQVKLDNENKETDDIDSEELMKFIVFGWYVYNVLLKDETLLDE